MRNALPVLILSLSISSSCVINLAQASQKQAETSLYQRLGGYNAIVAVVNDLVPRLAKDKQLGRFWEHRGSDGIEREKQLLIDFISNKAGGNLYYTGRNMKISHKNMRISESDWKRLMTHLNATLDKFKLATRERQDVISFIESTKDDMVELP